VLKQSKGGAVINPFDNNLLMAPEQIQRMKEVKDINSKGSTQHEVKADEEVKIGDPQVFPHEMADAIADYAKTNDQINALYLKAMIRGDEVSFLIVVDTPEVDKTVFDAIADAAKPEIPKGMFIDMVHASTDFGKQVISMGKPFYTK